MDVYSDVFMVTIRVHFVLNEIEQLLIVCLQ